MELVTELVNNQFALCIPALVIVGAILLFTFGFKSAEQPPFDKLSSNIGDDRKSAGKKRKLKEKKPAINGHVVNVGDNKTTDRSPTKETKRSADVRKEKKAENLTKTAEKKKNEAVKPKRNETVEDIKNKKNAKSKSSGDKPVDFDDGNWETVPAKGDKKKKQDSPSKKEKKVKKVDRPLEIEKLVKETVNKEIQEKTRELSPELVEKHEELESVESEVAPVELEIVPVEVKKEKKAEKKVKKEPVKSDVIVKPIAVEVEAVDEPTDKEPSGKKEDPPQGGVAFDELGDVWTEAKLAKKNKKKTRRDN